MENLEFLLEEEKNLNEKIKKGLESLKEWFEAKMDQAKEILSKTKAKAEEKLKKMNKAKKKGKKLVFKKTLKDKKGKTLIKAGDSVDKAISMIKSTFSDIVEYVKEIIDKCKKGIRSVLNLKPKEAKYTKQEIEDLFIGVFQRISALAAVGCFTAYLIEKKGIKEI